MLPHRARRLKKSASEGVGDAAASSCILSHSEARAWRSKSSDLEVEVLGLGGRSPQFHTIVSTVGVYAVCTVSALCMADDECCARMSV